jgi:hypothetical protein
MLVLQMLFPGSLWRARVEMQAPHDTHDLNGLTIPEYRRISFETP